MHEGVFVYRHYQREFYNLPTLNSSLGQQKFAGQFYKITKRFINTVTFLRSSLQKKNNSNNNNLFRTVAIQQFLILDIQKDITNYPQFVSDNTHIIITTMLKRNSC